MIATALRTLAVGVAYWALCRLSLSATIEPGHVEPFWFASGLSLAVLVRNPPSSWPRWLLAIGIASLIGDLQAGYAPRVALLLALANVVEPTLAAVLLRSRRTPPGLHRPAGLIGLTLATAPACAVGAGLGALALALTTVEMPFAQRWPLWFLDDWLGIIVVAPLILAWWPASPAEPAVPPAAKPLELIAIFAGLLVASLLAFDVDPAAIVGYHQPYWTLPFLLWAALRAGARGVTAAAVLLVGIALAFTLGGRGPFALADLPTAQHTLGLQVFLGLNVLSALALSATVAQHGRAERALAASETRYRQIVESTREGVWTIDERAHTTFVNDRMATMLGRRPGEMLGRHLLEFMDDAARRDAEANLGRRREGLSEEHLFRFRHADGHEVWTRISTDPLHDAGGGYAGAIALVSDVTEQRHRELERRDLEERLRQSQKMEAIGVLAGGVAHDFNNLLTAISGNAELALEQVEPNTDLHEMLTEISRAGERARSLTTQLLVFSRKQVLEFRILDLAGHVREASKMMRRVIGEHVAIHVVAPDAPVMVRADSTQLDLVLLNLAANARDAMPRGGDLTIEVATNPGDAVVLRVADTGSGIPAEAIPHVFEPFFTTKPKGRGTGLGLATVHGVVQQHDGEIHVRSEPGSGTTFEIRLPVARPDARPDPADVASSPAGRGGERVLVVEDDEQVFALATSILRQQGYRVSGARDPEQAVAMVDADAAIDLLVTDVVMPGRSGVELYEALRRARPELRVLLVSGYPEGFLGEHGGLTARLPLLRKPFSADELRRRVREILDA